MARSDLAEGGEDVEAGRAVLFRKEVAEKNPGLRVSPVGVVEDKEKLRVNMI